MSKIWVVAVDGSEGSERAAVYAADQAADAGATLALVHVIDWSQFAFLTPEELAERHHARQEEIDNAQERILKPLADQLSAKGVEIKTHVHHGHPADEIAALVEQLGASQIFSGRRGHNRLSQLIFGSVAGALMQSTTVPLTIVP